MSNREMAEMVDAQVAPDSVGSSPTLPTMQDVDTAFHRGFDGESGANFIKGCYPQKGWTMKDLIERLERAAGADRELDCLVWAARSGYEPIWRDNDLLARNRKPPHDTCWLGSIDPGKTQRNFSETRGFNPPIPAYTASLDAALTLLPEGYAVNSLTIWHGCPSSVTILGTARRPFGKDRRVTFCHTVTDGKWTAEAATPALAVSAAALKARADGPQSDMEAGR